MDILGKKNKGTIFFKTVVNIDDETVRYLHILPDFRKNLQSYYYEIHGSDGARYEADVSRIMGNSGIISFKAKLGHTYFIKIIGRYENDKQEIFLFYKMEDNFEEEEEEEDSDTDEKSSKNDEIEDVNVEKEEELEENKITRYLSSRMPNSGLEIENEVDLESL